MAKLSARWRALRRYLPNAHERRELAIFAALLPCAWLPRSTGAWIVRRIAAFQMRPGRRYQREMEAKIPPPLLAALGSTPHDALIAAETGLLADRLTRLIGLAAPWRPPPIAVRGMQHVEAALGQGLGAILWVHVCSGSSVNVKRALAEHGYPLVHLSRPGHPFSSRPFGRRIAGPILRWPEVRVLKERIEISAGNMTGPLRHLRRALGENHLASITVTPAAGRVGETPCLGGTLRLPAGPVELAAASGAALLPVFAFGAPWSAVVIIGQPLPVTGRHPAAISETHRAAAAWLEHLALQHPATWWGWRSGGWRPTPGHSPANQSPARSAAE